MTLNEYQREAIRTAAMAVDHHITIAVLSLGLTGEAGEAADHVKKFLGHGHPLDKDKMKKELGDVLWYVATLSNEHGFSLNDVAMENVKKLRARYPAGFTTANSLNRSAEK